MTQLVEPLATELEDKRATAGAGQPAAPPGVRNGQPSPPAAEAPSSTNGECEHGWLASVDEAGVVYTHRLPHPPVLSAAESAGASLTDLLTGRRDATPSTSPALPLLAWCDQQLDDAQREAVQRALLAPELALIQGLPGTGKSRVLAEVIRQIARRGERMLLVGLQAGPVDGLLGSVANDDSVLALRCLGGGETSECLSAEVRALVFAAHAQRWTSDAVEGAARERQRLHAGTLQAEHDLQTLTDLRAVAEHWERLEAQRHALATERADVPNQVRNEAQQVAEQMPGEPGFARNLKAERVRHSTALQTLEDELRQTRERLDLNRQEHTRWTAQVQSQEQVVRDRRGFRVWSLAWWRAIFKGRAQERLDEFRSRARESLQALTACEDLVRELETRIAAERDSHQRETEHLVQTEIAQRQATLERQLQELAEGQSAACRTWEQHKAELQSRRPLPVQPEVAQVERAAIANEAERVQLKQQEAAAQRWCDTLQGIAPNLPDHIKSYVNLAAGPISALAADPFLQEQSVRSFDWLIVEHADQLGATDLLAAARLAHRCILAGQPPVLAEGADANATPFHRLWQALHCDPRKLPYQWLQDGHSLTCRLFPVPADQRSWLELERLADQPDIELRILAVPKTEPILAEVEFPLKSFSIESAKQFVFHHLEDPTLRPTSSSLRWRALPAQIRLELGPPPLGQSVRLCLGSGVHEIVCSGLTPAGGNGVHGNPTQWMTWCVEFDRSAGWDMPRAQRWVQERARLCDLGRTSLLESQYRATPAVLAFWSHVLGHGAGGRRPHPGDASAAVQFVPVPRSVSSPAGKSAKQGSTGKSGKPATGAELNLADPRQRQRLPEGVRDLLPSAGFVNLQEAQAIVQMLETLVREPVKNGSPTAGDPAPLVAALALQAPQSRLIKALWAQHAASASVRGVCICTAAEFRGRTAGAVLLSLCRSNGQKPSPYADDPADWHAALTSARSQIVLFGDPGALTRRSQHQGVLEHQDAAAAAWERLLATRLLEHVEKHDRQPRLLVVREGALT